MRVACNASPLIWLSHSGHFVLLQDLFEAVLIPPEIQAETVERAVGYPSAQTVRSACEAGWMVVVPPADTERVTLLRSELHAGESEMLVMADEQGVEAVLVDDLRARHLATVLGLRVDVQLTLDDMRRRGFRLADSVYQAILQRLL